MGPDMGMPRFYDVVADSMALSRQRIHYSRVLRIDGVELPYWQKISENLWGQSVIERLIDRLTAFDSTTVGAAQLVYKAHLRTYKVDGLRDIIATGGKAFEGLVKQIEMIRQYQSNEGMTLMDSKDEFEAHQYAFSGLSDMMMQFAQQVSGALQIPMVRLMGQAPAGLGGEHEGELTNYYDSVKQQQEKKLRSGVEKIYDVLYRSTFGKEPPKGWQIKFRPLWQMSDEKKANVTTSITTAVVGAYESQIIDRSTALKEVRQLGQITGTFSNITDEQIEEAENDPTISEGLPDVESLDPRQEKEGGESGQDKPGAAAVSNKPDQAG
jgi:phage-related protein (TIGR01555 family)